MYIIPPKSPKHNSKVENANTTLHRSLFVPQQHCLDVPGVNEALEDFAHQYNDCPILAFSTIDEQGKLHYHTPNKYIRAFYQSANENPA